MAMTNYPYPTSFLLPMPAWPVNVAAKYFDGMETAPSSQEAKIVGELSNRETKVFDVMLKSANVYFFNNSTTPNCTDISDVDATGNLDGYGWNVLSCNQIAMPETDGPNSMFIDQMPFNYTSFTGKLNYY